MWYVLYCPMGNVEATAKLLRAQIDCQILTDAFVFTFERMRRYEGSWHRELTEMLPYYVVLQSDDETSLRKELKKHRFSFCGSGDAVQLTQIRQEDMEHLLGLCGDNHHIPLSSGVIQARNTRVLSGPLKGKEQMIRKIDRHKRLAYLQSKDSLPGVKFCVGLEITEKRV